MQKLSIAIFEILGWKYAPAEGTFSSGIIVSILKKIRLEIDYTTCVEAVITKWEKMQFFTCSVIGLLSELSRTTLVSQDLVSGSEFHVPTSNLANSIVILKLQKNIIDLGWNATFHPK